MKHTLLACLLMIGAGSHAQTSITSYDLNIGKAGSYPSDFTIFNDKLYFTATDSAHGAELWEADGINPPKLAVDINPGPLGSMVLNGMCELDGRLYLTTQNG